MKSYGLVIVLFLSMVLVGTTVSCDAQCPAPRTCVPDRPIPPESVGPVSLPFDFPVWPTLLKTEFHIVPWVSLGKTSVCIPCTNTAIDIPTPCFSLKALPVWIPWLRPLDTECGNCNTSWIP